MSDAANIGARITADSTQFVSGVNKAKESLGGLKSSLATSAADLAKYGAAAVVAGAAVTAALVASAMQSVDAQAKLARAVGGSMAGMQALDRAASRAGVSQDEMRNAATKLNNKLGEAMLKGGNAADAFKRLGLDAATLSGMDVDKRFSAIAQALDKQGYSTQEAGFALREMGIKQSSVITLMQEGDAAITSSSDAIAKYGISLTDVDAQKIEDANDAFDDVKLILSGVIQQLAVKVAPLITAVATMFTDAGTEAGGFGSIAGKVFDGIVRGAAFVMNAFDGIKRLLSLVLDGIIKFAAEGGVVVDKMALGIVETLNKVPGVDMSSTIDAIKQDLAATEAIAATASKRIADAINTPLAGDQFLSFVKKAEAAATAAAEATVSARVNNGPTGVDSEEDQKADKSAADNAAKEAEANRKRVADKIASLQESFATEQQMLGAKFVNEQLLLEDALALKQITEDEAAALRLQTLAGYEQSITDLEKTASDKRKQIAEAEAAAKMQTIKGVLSEGSALMNSGSRKMFEIGKASAIANAVISVSEGISKAWSLGPILGPAGAALVALNGFAQIKNIRAQKFGGGGGSVPATQTASAASAPFTPTGQQSGGGSNTSILLQGFDESKFYSGSTVRGLAESFVNFSRGGGRMSVQFAP